MHTAASSADIGSEILASTAFGPVPGRAAAELPESVDHRARWHRAVALAGQGRYAAARADLRVLTRASLDPGLASLVESTSGSLLRQLGWHDAASAHDGRAARLACAATGVARAEALADAYTGLAADALGTGRLALATRLLGRVEPLLDEAPARARVRWHWVRAETAMAGGGFALDDATRAATVAAGLPSVRHQVKSALLVAAATAASGDLPAAARLAENIDCECRDHALLPLRWACAMLRSGVAEDPSVAMTAAREAADHAARIRSFGGDFRPPRR
ncbi:hypothetical protein [Nocardia caishijiensis]|uniref:Uncharacterized protein n=1 Tax=Nocardia caishijiensis TaxID=184756 RepID=A0ABQ6YRV8_9NOCA|nr:hypothetical protein [Nocardia caishijiensis]KAF0848373.1 hypothetical protein FNL39_102521 [Nocardia caishijiensis]